MYHSLPLVALLATASSALQSDNIVNPSLPIRGCGNLTCAGTVDNSICGADGFPEFGIGMVTDAIQLPTTNLSFTLIDGEELGRAQLVHNTYDWYSLRSLYVGAPTDTDLANAPTACVLTMQYEGATFPYDENSFIPSSNSTICPDAGFDRASLKSVIQQFTYESSNSSSVSRCEALASFVEQSLNDKLFLVYYGALINVLGGTVSGPGVNTTKAQIRYDVQQPTINSDACMPVLPQDFTLNTAATSAWQPLRNAPLSQKDTYGGRDGFTPVYSVVYGEDNATPDVTLYCMHLWTKNGSSLAYSSSQLEREFFGAGSRTFGQVGRLASIIAGLLVGAALLS